MGRMKPLSSKELINAKKKSVFYFLFLQFIVSILATLVVFYTNGYIDAYSFLLGSMVSVLPSLYMAFRVFSGSKVKTAQEIVKSFYKGEAGKIIIAALLLSLIFMFIEPLSAGLFFIGYGIIILSHWLSPVVIK